MARIYSTLFYADSLPLAGTALAPVPAGELWVVREVSAVASNKASDFGFDCGAIRQGAGGLYVPFVSYSFDLFTTPTNPTQFEWEGRQVIPAADYLYLTASAGSCMYVTVSGYLLTP